MRSKAATSAAPDSTCSKQEPPADGRLTKLAQVVATPHIAASTVEAQELVGTETAMNVRDFLRDGVIRNAVNFPALPAEEYALARPWMQLAGRLGSLVAQLATGRTHGVGIRYYGPLVSARSEMLASAVVAGVLQPLLSSAVTIVNARAVAVQRGIEIIETRSSRPRDFTNLLSVKLHTSEGERWVEGTVFEPGMPAAGGDRRRRDRGAARRHADRHHQQRSAWRHRRGRHDSRPPRPQHRELCVGPRQRAVPSAWSRSTSHRRTRVRCVRRSTRFERRKRSGQRRWCECDLGARGPLGGPRERGATASGDSVTQDSSEAEATHGVRGDVLQLDGVGADGLDAVPIEHGVTDRHHHHLVGLDPPRIAVRFRPVGP